MRVEFRWSESLILKYHLQGNYKESNHIQY